MESQEKLIEEMELAISQLDPEAEAERVTALKLQLVELRIAASHAKLDNLTIGEDDYVAAEKELGSLLLERSALNGVDSEKIGMENVDKPSESEKVIAEALKSIGMGSVQLPTEPSEEVEPINQLVDQFDRRPASEVYELVDEYLAETEQTAPLSALGQALEACKIAHLKYDQFTAEHEGLLNLQSDLSFARTKLKRIMYGLLARHAQDNVRINITKQAELGTLWELEVEEADLLPDVTGYQIDYSIEPAPARKKIAVINDQEFIEWCLSPMGNRDLLVIDAEKAKDYVMDMRAKAVKERKSEKVPTSPPPASIVARIKPTVGKIKYDDLTTEETFSIEFQSQGETEPLFKIVSSHSSTPIATGLVYPEAKTMLEGLKSEKKDESDAGDQPAKSEK